MTVTNSFTSMLDGLYGRLHQRFLILFSLTLALICAGSVIWDAQFLAERIGGFHLLNASAFIWATCTGLIHGIGFKPHFWFWQLFFFPPLAWIVLGTFWARSVI